MEQLPIAGLQEILGIVEATKQLINHRVRRGCYGAGLLMAMQAV